MKVKTIINALFGICAAVGVAFSATSCSDEHDHDEGHEHHDGEHHHDDDHDHADDDGDSDDNEATTDAGS